MFQVSITGFFQKFVFSRKKTFFRETSICDTRSNSIDMLQFLRKVKTRKPNYLDRLNHMVAFNFSAKIDSNFMRSCISQNSKLYTISMRITNLFSCK